MEETKIYHVDGKYRIVFEQAASTKGIIGFKVEVNGDDKAMVEAEATELLDYAKAHAPILGMEVKC
jgi:hypothetical protein